VKLLDLSFGSPGSALLKLAAISLAPDAIGQTTAYFFSSSTGMFVGWAVSLVLYYMLFSYLFDLDGGETLLLTAIVWVVRVFLGAFIIAALFALVAGTAVASGGFGGGKTTAASIDSDVQDDLDVWGETEAQGWIEESRGRLFGKEGHEECVAMVKTLYELGAQKVLVFKEGPVASQVVVVLPKKKEQRTKIFEWFDKNKDKYGWLDQKDAGQKYLTLDFNPFASAGERAKMQAQMKAQQQKSGAKQPAAAEEEDEQ
jgi:hypothetical protein